MSLKESASAIKLFIQKLGVTYPVALDPTGKLLRPFNIQSVPGYFFLDRQRVVRVNGDDISAAEILELINSLVGEQVERQPR